MFLFYSHTLLISWLVRQCSVGNYYPQNILIYFITFNNTHTSKHPYIYTSMPIHLSQCISVMKPHVLFAISFLFYIFLFAQISGLFTSQIWSVCFSPLFSNFYVPLVEPHWLILKIILPLYIVCDLYSESFWIFFLSSVFQN